ncbi:MAG: hypothetical protein ACRD2L_19985, partial [Terriglobia bacterium]
FEACPLISGRHTPEAVKKFPLVKGGGGAGEVLRRLHAVAVPPAGCLANLGKLYLGTPNLERQHALRLAFGHRPDNPAPLAPPPLLPDFSNVSQPQAPAIFSQLP